MNVAPDRLEAALAASGTQIITLADERYPPLLKTIHDPPPRLFVRGDPAFLLQPQIAIVGSRRASSAGQRAAATLASELVQAGLHVCSGLALGIDGAAHRGALQAGGRSIAVMATGIDRVYPSRHSQLATELVASGCLVTEFEPGMRPYKGNFPKRNRIISGLSLGVLVIEAALPSGSLITAGTALEQGREVFTLPWSIFHPAGQGCLRLIRDGAKMVQTVEDVLEELGPLYTLQQDLFVQPDLAEAAGNMQKLPAGLRRVLDILGDQVCAVDELARCSGLPVAQLLADLSALEVAGLIERRVDGYVRCP